MTSSIDYSQKISELRRYVETETYFPWQFNGYYTLAKLQILSGLTSEASASYSMADQIRQENSSINILRNILKLVKLSVLINPKQEPDLLSVAEEKINTQKEWIEKYGEKSVRRHECTVCSTKVAACYYHLKDYSKADQYLANAIQLSGTDDPVQCLKAYKQIAKICAWQNKKDQFKKIVSHIEIQLQNLALNTKANICLMWHFKMTELAYKIDRNCGKKMLVSVSQFVVENRQNLLGCNNYFQLDKEYKSLQQMMK